MHRKVLKYPDIPQKMVEYLLGKFDFYKVISIYNTPISQRKTDQFTLFACEKFAYAFGNLFLKIKIYTKSNLIASFEQPKNFLTSSMEIN